MINRYSTQRMKNVWSDKNKFKTFLQVEIATLEAFVFEKKIPKDDVILIKKKSKINIPLIREIEKETKHDVIAFTRSISKTLGDEKKWFHYGLTSTDVVDTAYSLQFKKANKYILSSLKKFLLTLKTQAMKNKNIPVIGRTHGVHAEVTSLGLKFALWYNEMQRNIERFKTASQEIEVSKISGAVGNFANISTNIQDHVSKTLGLKSSKISTQILQRDRHANYISVLAIIGSTLEKIAFEVRNSQRTEVNEIMEFFDEKQKGSSAMPHKKNPIASENIVGVARLLRGYVVPAMENNALWYERDISHSSVERVIIPDATNLIDYALNRYEKVISNLIINKEKMLENIHLTKGAIFSQRILTKLIEKGISREKSYDLVQSLAIESFENKKYFLDILKENKQIKKYLSTIEMSELFDLEFYLKEVDTIF
ncbi:MAG: adenylosuccinate lyase, partial [Mycoplasmataceae bacterium]|nr:adenylosuccinate lyase [Mycoplasmataceae bacterium]